MSGVSGITPLAGGCGSPLSRPPASAYSLNITVIPVGPLGYLSLLPDGNPYVFSTSILNSPDSRTKANAAIVASGNMGRISLAVSDPTNVIIDINGYFIPASPSTLAFYSVHGPPRLRHAQPQRSTRRPISARRSRARLPGARQQLQHPQRRAGLLDELHRRSLQRTGLRLPDRVGQGKSAARCIDVEQSNGDHCRQRSRGASREGGEISVYASGNTQLVGDINGYFAPAQSGGLSLYTLQPCRALDTRQQNLAFNGEITIDIATSPCAPPTSAQAYVMNATVVPDPTLNYLTLWPDGEGRPMVRR